MRSISMLVGVVLVAGCAGQDGGAAPDAATPPVLTPDATPEPAGCEYAFGRSYILDLLEVVPEGDGLDLDGDGTIDNSLGFLSSLANPGYVQSIDDGGTIVLFDVIGMLPAADPMRLNFYIGVDADEPSDPSNNTSGAGQFLVHDELFDVACQPISELGNVVFADRTLSASAAPWAFVLPWLGTVEFEDMRMTLVFDPDLNGFDVRAGAIWSLCGLANTPFPGAMDGTMLDTMVNGFNVPPDIDRDGDGLERIVGDGTTVKECIDGDGTVISGADCPCDPRMVDGYSAAFHGTAVRATIVGVTPPGT